MTVTKAQYELALEKANEVRVFRGELKQRISTREVTVQSVLRSPPWQVESMRVCELLMAQPGWARVKTAAFLREYQMGESLKVSQLTEEQEGLILAGLDGHWVRRRADARDIERQVARWQRRRMVA